MPKHIHYVNLTNGIQALPELVLADVSPRFLRIQSTICEQHDWERMILDLDYDFLMNLALGNHCHVYDYGADKPVPRALFQGLAFLRFTLERRWFGRETRGYVCRNDHSRIDCTRQFDHWYRNLPKRARKKLDYFKPYLRTDTLRLYQHADATDHDGNKRYYRNILHDFMD